jgi:hypothetical protein
MGIDQDRQAAHERVLAYERAIQARINTITSIARAIHDQVASSIDQSSAAGHYTVAWYKDSTGADCVDVRRRSDGVSIWQFGISPLGQENIQYSAGTVSPYSLPTSQGMYCPDPSGETDKFVNAMVRCAEEKIGTDLAFPPPSRSAPKTGCLALFLLAPTLALIHHFG